MIKETCNKCGNDVIEDRKLDNTVWNCPNCGLEEYQSVNNSIKEANRFDLENAIKPEAVTEIEVSDEGLISFGTSNSPTKKVGELKSALDLAPEPTISGMFHYAGKNKLFMTIDSNCKLCCEFRLDRISFEVDFSDEIERVLEYRKERDVIEHLSELMIERFVKEANRRVIEFVEFVADDSVVKTALLSYANKGLVFFDITEAVTEIEVSDDGLISFSPLDAPIGLNKTTKYMTKEEIEKHNTEIDKQVKAMDGFLDELFS